MLYLGPHGVVLFSYPSWLDMLVFLLLLLLLLAHRT